jgi:hypothetical protein
MSGSVVYANYWERKRLLAGPVPHFPVRRWWPTDGLCDIEQVYFDAIGGASRLLDVGAGDLRVMRKFQAAGFAGEYHTQDVGTEFPYTYADLDLVTGRYDAVLCLDVIEHLPLEGGLGLLTRLLGLLTPDGVLVVQTPNARCVRHPLSWDMTHLHVYNLPDLWAFFRARGLGVDGYRVAFGRPGGSLRARAVGLVGKYVAARLLGCDYADNIALVVRAPGGAGPR